MTNLDPKNLPLPVYAGGTKAITFTPVVGKPRLNYPEMYIPGNEDLEVGEMRVTVLGSGNPWTTRAPGFRQHPGGSWQPGTRYFRL